MSTVITLVVLVLLVALTAFFASSETAYLSISSVRLRQMKKSPNRFVRLAANLRAEQSHLLTTILIGTNVVVNLSSSIATALAISIAGKNAAGIATIAISFAVILFGEILPKNTASIAPETTATRAALPLFIVQKLFFPVIKLFELINSGIENLVNLLWHDDGPSVTEDELKTLIDVGDEEGTLETGEKDLLYKIFEFTDLRVRDIQTHRSKVIAINENATYRETVEAITESGFSRLPIYRGDPENIVGLIHYKDVLYYTGNRATFTPKELKRTILFVPETLFVESLLKQFRTEKRNFAVVITEHGSMSGIVTMDDILQAVFGRITDEYQKEEPPENRIRVKNRHEFFVPGDFLLTDCNRYFGLHLASEDFDTVGGWLLERIGYLPEPGEKVQEGNMTFYADEIENRRIQTVLLQFGRRQ